MDVMFSDMMWAFVFGLTVGVAVVALIVACLFEGMPFLNRRKRCWYCGRLPRKNYDIT